MDRKRVRVLIEGRVQGVLFRDSTRTRAQSLGVTGWVRNRFEGSVEAVFEGEAEAVDTLVRWCEQGPRFARVERVTVTPEPFRGEFSDFQIRW
jgi:acylphosphatase